MPDFIFLISHFIFMSNILSGIVNGLLNSRFYFNNHSLIKGGETSGMEDGTIPEKLSEI